MLNFVQAFILGGLQGITELFPISSLGHSVILPTLFGWHVNQSDSFFLIFLVATHLATSIVLFLFFFKDWVQIISGIFRSLAQREISPTDNYAKLGWLLVVGTIPTGILGLLFEERFKMLFASPLVTSVLLICNGGLLFFGEALRKKRSKTVEISKEDDARIAKQLTWRQAIYVGSMQSVALFPGFSRTGSSVVGGLLVGLTHEDAARFSFLLATPIIGAAAILKLPELALNGASFPVAPLIIGSLSSAFFAYSSVKFLTKYFKENDLKSFAIYCTLAGLFSTAILLFR